MPRGSLNAWAMASRVISWENDAACLVLRDAQDLAQMPRYSFAFPVRVCGEVYSVSTFCGGFDLVDHLSAVGHDAVFGVEIVININAHVGFWQVAYMSDRSLNCELVAKVTFDSTRLGCRFDDD